MARAVSKYFKRCRCRNSSQLRMVSRPCPPAFAVSNSECNKKLALVTRACGASSLCRNKNEVTYKGEHKRSVGCGLRGVWSWSRDTAETQSQSSDAQTRGTVIRTGRFTRVFCLPQDRAWSPPRPSTPPSESHSNCPNCPNCPLSLALSLSLSLSTHGSGCSRPHSWRTTGRPFGASVGGSSPPARRPSRGAPVGRVLRRGEHLHAEPARRSSRGAPLSLPYADSASDAAAPSQSTRERPLAAPRCAGTGPCGTGCPRRSRRPASSPCSAACCPKFGSREERSFSELNQSNHSNHRSTKDNQAHTPVHGRKELIAERFVADQFRIIGEHQSLGMPSEAGAHLRIARPLRATLRVPDARLDHPGQPLEVQLRPPEAPACN
jgi:hypothetical protein